MPTNVTDHALVIGLNEYPRYLGGRRNLAGAVSDATAFRDWLIDKDIGGGVPDTQVHLLSGSDVRREDIDAELFQILEAARGGARRLYFFCAGHGQAVDASKLALLLPHWSIEFRQAALSLVEYRDYMLRCLPFSEVVGFFDCCRVWSVDVVGYGSELSCPTPRDGAGATRTYFGFAAEFQRQSYEGLVTGGPVDPDLEAEGAVVRGYFTRALLDALWGGAARPEGGVTGPALKAYLERHVPALARKDGYVQEPRVPQDFPEEQPIVFGSAPPPDHAAGVGRPGGKPPWDATVAPKPGEPERHEVTISALADPLVQVEVYDGADALVFHSASHTDSGEDARLVQEGGHRSVSAIWLPTGQYRFVQRRLGLSEETDVPIEEPISLGLAWMGRSTPLTSADSTSNHEYYLEPAEEYAIERTGGPVGEGVPVGGLMFMLRSVAAEANEGLDLAQGWRLLDHAGVELATMPGDGVGDPGEGWAVLSVDAAAGSYVLEYAAGPVLRQAAVRVAPGRQTRVFMHSGRLPAFATVSLQLPYLGAPFDADTATLLSDGALAGLQSGFEVVPEDLLRHLLADKFNDPMLGLVGAHLLLDRGADDLGLLETVQQNLVGLLGSDHPDVQGITARTVIEAGLTADVGEIAALPMLRASAEALYRWTAHGRGHLEETKALALVAAHRLSDSPWFTWAPPHAELLSDEVPVPPTWLVEAVGQEARDRLQTSSDLAKLWRDPQKPPSIAAMAARLRVPEALIAQAWAEATGGKDLMPQDE